MKKINESRAKKRNLISAIIIAAVFSINAFLIVPFLALLSNDVLYADGWPLLVAEYFTRLLDVCAVSIGYALLITYIYETRRVRGVFAIIGLLFAYRNTANMLALWIDARRVSSSWIWEAVNVLYYTALELVLVLIIYLIAKRAIEKHHDRAIIAQRVFESTGENLPVEAAYPFKRIFDRKNCLLSAAVTCAIVTFVAKIFGQLADDIWYIIADGWPTQASTWGAMALNYVSQVIFGLAVYFAVRTALVVMLKRKTKEKE